VHVHEAVVAEEAGGADGWPDATVPMRVPGSVDVDMPSSATAPAVQPLIAQRTPVDQRTPLRTVVTAPRQPATPDSSPTFSSLSGRKNVPEPSVEVPLGIGLLGERPVQRVAHSTAPVPPTPQRTVPIASAGTAAVGEAVQRTFTDARPPVARTPPAVQAVQTTPKSPLAPTTFTTTEADGMQTITFGEPEEIAVQRAPDDDPTSTVTAPDLPTETTTRAESASVGPAAPVAEGPRQPTDAEVQDMLQALYPSLRRRLSRDLLLDRERLGYRTDIRF
jgi:hypothetical protein